MVTKHMSRALVVIAGAASFCVLAVPAARAQVTAPSVYTTAIQVQGEAPGTEFDDWASSGITIVDMDPVDNPGGSPPFIDLANVQIANDNANIYIHVTTHGDTTSFANLFLAFDTDQNTATGFDVFGLGFIGSELGYQTDFPFGQATGMFNTNATITGGQFDNGGALIYPYWTAAGAPQGTEMEWAVPRAVMISGSPAFASNSFDLLIWTDTGLGDVTQTISYTLAEPPAGTGDFNGDGTVDAADYVLWRKNGGTQDDYNLWRMNFGSMPGSANVASSAAVPEPASILLVSLVSAALCGLRCRFLG